MAPHVDLDDPGNVDRMFAAMSEFLKQYSVGGRLQLPTGGPNFNQAPIPARFLREDGGDDIIVRFQSVEQFKTIHKAASMYENDTESKEVDDFNKSEAAYKAWPLLKTKHSENVDMWLILVEPAHAIETRVPSIGETCQLRLIEDDKPRPQSVWWKAKRTHNNFAKAGESKMPWTKLLAFYVTVVKDDKQPDPNMFALIPDNGNQQENLDNLVLDETNAINVGFLFTKSDATFDAEIRSLNKLVKAIHFHERLPPPAPVRVMKTDINTPMDLHTMVEQWLNMDDEAAAEGQAESTPESKPESKPESNPQPEAKARINPIAVQAKQVAAFKFLLDFRQPEFTVNMFELYPHMRQPDRAGSGIPPLLVKKFTRMNEHQREAYHGLLSNMPCGLAFLPGGPGGGKTDWAITVVGLLQSKTKAKVLYLLDINDPLDDATVKYIKLMQNAGMKKYPIRMRNFGTELKKSVRVAAVQERARSGYGGKLRFTIETDPEEAPEIDFSKNFLALYTHHTTGGGVEMTTHRDVVIPTLDEAAWDHYEKSQGEFSELKELLETCNGSALDNKNLRLEIYKLYKTVLDLADFIATTPCVAASALHHMFAPDLVVFDEAAHARELSTLIAIANFCPKVGWIFIGDHRQTQPTVKSNDNPHAKQLATSTMERAFRAGVLKHQLLINHRAYGRLERLPSKLIYGGKMISAVPFADRFPLWSGSIRKFFEKLSGERCRVPRVVVHLHGVGQPLRAGTSWYHPEHMMWAMGRVLELMENNLFRSADNIAKKGTVLLLAPYKAAVIRYQEAIQELAQAHPDLQILQRVEARTWDSSQGHEADIVGIDYVRDHPTDFMDGMYRFNVGLTRARQGEWHIMHPDMPRAKSFRRTKYLRKLYAACEQGLDGLSEGSIAHVHVDDGAGAAAGRVMATGPAVQTVLGAASRP